MNKRLLTLISCLLIADLSFSAETVSIINLIATPDKYHGKMVRVVGYLINEFENTAIYLSENDAKNSITKNALWLDIHDDHKYVHLNKKYVIVEGTLDAKKFGHGALFSCVIKKVSRLDAWDITVR